VYTLAGAAATISLAFLVVPAHHAAGAAFAMCVGGGIVTVPFVLIMSRVILNVGAGELLRATAGPLCALALAAGLNLGGAAISSTFGGAVVTGLVATSIYIVFSVALILDGRERSVLLGLVRRRKREPVQDTAAYSSIGPDDAEMTNQMPEPAETPATENGAAIGVGNEPGRAWRASLTLGGKDAVNERAWPGMPAANIMSEHTSRYAFALGLVGGKHVLDLGCGTGYGSEMLSWAAASVRGFDLWQPADAERPCWPGVEELNYGHDLCTEPLPAADAAVMFEVMEHLPNAPRALEIAFKAVPALICSFRNPDLHGSSHNRHRINDWPLAQVEREMRRAAEAAGRRPLRLTHLYQPYGSPLIRLGHAPQEAYWIIVADASPTSIVPPIVRVDPLVTLKRRLRVRSRLGLR
jgi:SAM-dependent methyltransferase